MQNKIYWYCFKRQLEELYYLLFFEKYISCDADEFISHFTGKKFRIGKNYSGKLLWNNEKYLLFVVFNHLIEKKFIDAKLTELLNKHFEGCAYPVNEEYKENINKTASLKLKKKMETLFPMETGYRCKLRLYYKARNKESIFSVLTNCRIKD